MNCNYCSHELSGKGFFCSNCGKQITCIKCKEALEKDAKACVYCGNSVGEGNSLNMPKDSITELRNTIKYNETKDTKSLDIAFSDNVADSISNLSSIITNHLIRPTRKIFKEEVIEGNILSEENLGEKETTNLLAESSNSIVSQEFIPHIKSSDLSTNNNSEYEFPVINDIVRRDLPEPEWEWVLIYSLYASNFGEKSFKAEDIRVLYSSTGRKTVNRLKNLSRCITEVINKKFIKSKNEHEFIILDSGKEYAIKILERTSASKSSGRTKSNLGSKKIVKKEVNKKKGSSEKFIDLEFKQVEIEDFKVFFNSIQSKGQEETILMILKWFRDKKQKNEVSLQEILYLFKFIDSKEPKALKQVTINMQGSKNWIDKTSSNNFKLTTIGETYISSKLKKNS